MVILDSDILIDHLRQKGDKATHFIRVSNEIKETLAVSIISLQELYAGKSTRIYKKEKLLLTILSNLKILPYSRNIAELAGMIIRDSGFPVRFADAAIAATAIINNASLFTLNQKHFKGIKTLNLFKL